MSIGRQGRRLALVMVAAIAGAACADRPLPLEPAPRDAPTAPVAPATDAQIRAALIALNGWENETRQATDFAQVPVFERRSGANPHAVVAHGNRVIGALRGSDQLVVLDAGGNELSRAPAPASPVDIAVSGEDIFVVGERTSEVWIFALQGDALVRRGEIKTQLLSPRAIAAQGSRVFVADDASGRLVMFERDAQWRGTELGSGHGPLDLAATASHLVAVYSLDHQLRIWRLETAKVTAVPAKVQHDGPLWTAVATDHDGDLFIASAGIEDRPLDRSDQGSFGYIDSFAFVHRLRAGKLERLAAINVSTHGLITSKWLELEMSATPRLRLGSYGGDRLLELSWTDSTFGSEPTAATRPLAPGTTAIARLGERAVLANPLLDAWVVFEGDKSVVRRLTAPDPRSIESRIGELLFFTHLMAPWSESTDRRSRFTCEACHVEGYGDGRTHFTGRDDVIATSRPLRGLFNNRPHFTRALDETTTEMVDNEFGVANKLNGRSPWFALKSSDFPWLAHVGGDVPATMSPVFLRRALMLFLRDFTHRPNPFVRSRTAFDAAEARGADVFRQRCEACHNARLVADDKATQVPFEGWAAHIFERPGVIVWGRSGYEKTGVLPYVHPKGARPPTLRRLYKKWPYFTNGTAKTLAGVLDGVRFDPSAKGTTGFGHAGGDGKKLSRSEQSDLLAFLALL